MHAGARSLGDGHTRWLAAEFGSPSAVSAVGVLAAAEIWPLFGLAVGRRRRLAVSAFTLSAVTRVLARSAEAGRTGASVLGVQYRILRCRARRRSASGTDGNPADGTYPQGVPSPG